MTRPTYIVNAERTPDGWWYLEAPDVDGAMTQSKRLDQADAMARDVIALAGRGYPQRDIGVLLGVTHQRVAQIMGGVTVGRGVQLKRVASSRGTRWRLDDDVSRSDVESEPDDARPR